MRPLTSAACFATACLLAACPAPEDPGPGPFVAGLAQASLPAPLGIGTSGFNGFAGAPDSDSPYVQDYPATTRLHAPPGVKAVALSRGEGYELVIARVDMVAVPQQVRDAVVGELTRRIGRDFDPVLILSGTHTHSGPGRFLQGGLYGVIADAFWPEYYDRLIDTIVQTIEAAIADAQPAELATAQPLAPDAHNDRRCEDGLDHRNDATPLLAIRRGGQVEAVVVNYAIHGTILGIDELTLSRDASGALEEGIEDGFDHPVMALMMNGWGGDMAPHGPEVGATEGLSAMPSGYDEMERIGVYMRSVIVPAVQDADYTAEPEIAGQTMRYPISRRLLGYTGSTFDFDYGAVYCSGDSTCDAVIDVDGLDEACIPFPENSPAPDRSLFTVGRIGDAAFTTWGGECGTLLAEEVMAAMRAAGAPDTIFFFGYGNDYLGYQLQEDDWWHGGYEASGAMWGPRQGDYMAEQQAAIWSAFADGTELPFEQPEAPALFDTTGSTTRLLEDAIEPGQEIAASTAVPVDGVATVTVSGWEPWFGTPVATLQREQNGTFVDVARPGGQPYDSTGYGFWVDIATDPTWDETVERVARRFHWTFSVPLGRADGPIAPVGARLRLRVELPSPDGATELLTTAFQVEG